MFHWTVVTVTISSEGFPPKVEVTDMLIWPVLELLPAVSHRVITIVGIILVILARRLRNIVAILSNSIVKIARV